MSREEHQALLNFRLATLGYIPPQTYEELQAFDVDKIINGEIKCEWL